LLFATLSRVNAVETVYPFVGMFDGSVVLMVTHKVVDGLEWSLQDKSLFGPQWNRFWAPLFGCPKRRLPNL